MLRFLSTRVSSLCRFQHSRFLSTQHAELSSYTADLSHIGNVPIATRVASVALIGAPNAGKSSLSNALIEARISAVSRKVNTTRDRTIGAYTRGNRQLIFWDTPGVVERQFLRNLGPDVKQLRSEAWGAAVDAQIVVMVVDTSRPQQHWKRCTEIVNQLLDLRDDEAHMLLALNKCDKVRPRGKILDAAEYFRDNINSFSAAFNDRIYMVSAYNGRGVDDLREDMLDLTEPGEFALDPDMKHGDEDLDLVRQHIWEKMLHRLHEEVPYRCELENNEMRELPDGSLFIAETIRVERSSVVPIVIGPKGGVVEWIREKAQESASEALGRKVVLNLHVKSR